MQVRLAESLQSDGRAQIAAAELRKCVHCGFCNVTCPTFQLQSNELDGPRGRLYLIKEMLETDSANPTMQKHLDRCLTCRACETTCPANLRYSLVLDQGREMLERKVPRGWFDRIRRRLLGSLLPRQEWFGPLLTLARGFRVLLPASWKAALPPRVQRDAGAPPPLPQARAMLLLDGCVQNVADPTVNAAARRVFQRLGITLRSSPQAGCCGALPYHLGDRSEAERMARRNIDAWLPSLDAEGAEGAEFLTAASSACGLMIKEYADLLAGDPVYSEAARRVSDRCREMVEILAGEDISGLDALPGRGERITLHVPCTLQHGQQLAGRVEALLQKAGFELAPVSDSHLCCGAAGTYMLFEPDFSEALLRRKVSALGGADAETVVSGNIGCQMHLSRGLGRRVGHWIELFDRV